MTIDHPSTTPIVVLTGPTGVGKTAVAMALAARVPLRVISADSMQIYRRMDIGTAKPTAAEQAQAPHDCIDLADPDESFSVAQYAAEAAPAIERAAASGKLPLVVGGTRLYLQALAGAFRGGSPPDPKQRSRLMAEAEKIGAAQLHQRLSQLDPEAAGRIHPNDLKRIIRALEVHAGAGKTISAIQQESRETPPLFQARFIALVGDREELYRAVEARTNAMLNAGWLEEVKGLLDDGYGPALSATKAHGYRELAAYLHGEIELPTAVEIINRNIRHYVRYQLGWIRQMPRVHLLQAGPPPEMLAEAVYQLLKSHEVA